MKVKGSIQKPENRDGNITMTTIDDITHPDVLDDRDARLNETWRSRINVLMKHFWGNLETILLRW